jgi:CRP-like cAMP-binding protein
MRTMSSFTDIVPTSTQLVETPDTGGAYPRLSDHQIATLELGGSRRAVHTGELLVREGHRCNQFHVILSGMAVITAQDESGAPQLIRVHGPRRFLGELAELEGQAAFYTAAMAADGEVLAVPAKRVRSLVEHDSVLSDLILRGISTSQAPVVILGEHVLSNPTNSQLARVVGLPGADTADREWDVVIVGAPSVASGNQSAWRFRGG